MPKSTPRRYLAYCRVISNLTCLLLIGIAGWSTYHFVMEDDDLNNIYEDYYNPTFSYFDQNRGESPIMDIRWSLSGDCSETAMGGVAGYEK